MQLSCLQLGFYLASWGMFRGRAELRNQSVKCFAPVVEAIVAAPAEVWEIDADAYTAEAVDIILEVSAELRRSLPGGQSDTLVSKAMLGVFGCVPAFDRFFRLGFGVSSFGRKSLRTIGSFYAANSEVIERYRVPTLDFGTGEESDRRYTGRRSSTWSSSSRGPACRFLLRTPWRRDAPIAMKDQRFVALAAALYPWVAPRRVATNVAETSVEGDQDRSSRMLQRGPLIVRTAKGFSRGGCRHRGPVWLRQPGRRQEVSRRASASPRGWLERMQLLTSEHRCVSERGSHGTHRERWVLLVDLRFRHLGRKTVEHHAHGNPRAAQPSLAVHNGRIHVDELELLRGHATNDPGSLGVKAQGVRN